MFFLMGQFMAPGPATTRGAGALDGHRRMKSQDWCTATGVDGRAAAVPGPDVIRACPATERKRHDRRQSTKFASGISR